MTIEEAIKATAPMPVHRRTLLNVIFTQHFAAERMSEILKPYAISAEQYNVLRILRGQKGKPANMCTIQERMLAKSSNTTRLIDKLLSKQLVTRETCPDNRRKMEVLITDKGASLLAELDIAISGHEKSFGTGMTEYELETLNALLEKFRNI